MPSPALPRRVPRPRPHDAATLFNPTELHMVVTATRVRRRRVGLVVLIDLVVLIGLLLTPAGQAVVAAAAIPAGRSVPLQAVLAACSVTAARALARFPLELRAWRHDTRRGLQGQPAGAWLRAWLRDRSLGALLTALPVAALVLAARYLPGFPFSGAALAAATVVAVTLLGPVAFEPLQGRFVPLPPGRLRARALALAGSLRLSVRDLLIAGPGQRPPRHNAYVSGLGRTRRIVLHDSLLSSSSESEILFVLAHELAHVRHRDVLLGTAAAALLLPAAVALLLLSPFTAATSRRAEARADWLALRTTRNPAAAISLLRRLALLNHADPRPGPPLLRLLDTHPPVMARVAQARMWARLTGAWLPDPRRQTAP